MSQHVDELVESLMRYRADHFAAASDGRVLIPAGVLRSLSATYGASLLMDILSGWEQDGDVVILGDWDSLPDDAPGIEMM
jgi:hypothetical protein